MYQINGFLKMYEEDVFADGGIPGSGGTVEVDALFTGKTAEAVIAEAQEYLGINEDGTERNACDEKGRIDFARTENEDGEELSPREFAEWKKGNIKAYYAVYSCFVEKITRVKV